MKEQSIPDLDVTHLIRRGSGSLCREGMILLRAFAEARPNDFAFLDASDLDDGSSGAFAGIDEWDAFAQHYGTCRRCRVR